MNLIIDNTRDASHERCNGVRKDGKTCCGLVLKAIRVPKRDYDGNLKQKDGAHGAHNYADGDQLFLDLCHQHRHQLQEKAIFGGMCQALDDGQKCRRPLIWTPPFLQLCESHREELYDNQKSSNFDFCGYSKLPTEVLCEIASHLVPHEISSVSKKTNVPEQLKDLKALMMVDHHNRAICQKLLQITCNFKIDVDGSGTRFLGRQIYDSFSQEAPVLQARKFSKEFGGAWSITNFRRFTVEIRMSQGQWSDHEGESSQKKEFARMIKGLDAIAMTFAIRGFSHVFLKLKRHDLPVSVSPRPIVTEAFFLLHRLLHWFSNSTGTMSLTCDLKHTPTNVLTILKYWLPDIPSMRRVLTRPSSRSEIRAFIDAWQTQLHEMHSIRCLVQDSKQKAYDQLVHEVRVRTESSFFRPFLSDTPSIGSLGVLNDAKILRDVAPDSFELKALRIHLIQESGRHLENFCKGLGSARKDTIFKTTEIKQARRIQAASLSQEVESDKCSE